MTLISKQIAANGDDGFSYSSTFDNSGSNVYFGNDSVNINRSFFRFINLEIPQSANIVSAKLQLYAGFSLSGSTCNLKIHFEAADNPEAPTTAADLSGRALTTGTDWNSIASWTSGTWNDSVDIKSELQEVINRPGWVENNAVTAHILNNSSSSGAYRSARTRNYSTTLGAKLIVEFTPAQDGQIDESINAGDDVNSFSLNDSISGSVGSGDSVEGYDFKSFDLFSVEITDSVFGYKELEVISQDSAGFGEVVSAEYDVQSSISESAALGDSADAFSWTEWLEENLSRAVARYYCTITGAADGETDIEVPISSFQARKQTGSSTYLSVVVPGVDYLDAISARANGEMIVEMAYLIDGVESLREEILRAEIEQINFYKGTGSRSVTLVGHLAQTFVAKETRLYDPVYSQRTDGDLSYRFAVPDLWLNPGDTVRVGDDAFTASGVIYMVSAGGGQTVMEVQE